MSIFTWFSKDEKVEVPDLEEIKLEPKVSIPEKTRRELYHLAVNEVEQKRVTKLILDDLLLISECPDSMRQLEEAEKAYPSGVLDSMTEVQAFKVKFPLVQLIDRGNYYDLVKPNPTLESLARVLATKYLSE